MAQSVIGALRVNLGLDSAQFSRGLTDAQKSLKAARAQFIAVAGVAAAAFGGIAAAAIKGASAIDANAKAARRIGASVGGFRALEMAASDAGVSLSGLANDIQTMNRELARAEIGEGNAGAALAKLGMAASDFSGLDADERVAVLADAVQRLGLDSGETTLLLRDLGIRNREMALLVMGGGDALRAARKDVQDYGLALSAVDTGRIEAANDQLAGLGDITTYIGDQLALKFVPALGAMAQAMTDSLREGGALRAGLDAIIGALDRVAAYGTAAVAIFGVRYVAALVAAAVSTASLSGALLFLRGALIRTGIGALVVLAGEMVYQFSRLVKGAGGFGNALSALGDLASGVWQGITTSAKAIPPALEAVWQMVSSSFFGLLSEMQESWSRFLGNLGADLADVPGMGGFADYILEASGKAIGAMTEFDARAQAAASRAESLKNQAASLASEGFDKAKAAAERLAGIVSKTSDEIETTTDSTTNLNDSLEELGGEGGGKAGKAAEAMESVKTETEAYNEALKEAAYTSEDFGKEKARIMIKGVDGLADSFADFTMRGFKDFKSFARSIVDTFKSMLRDMIVMAARNKIMVSLGMGGSVAGSVASAATGGSGGILSSILGGGGSAASGGGILGGIGTTLGSIGTNLSAGFMTSVYGGLGGLTGAVSGGIAAGGIAGVATAIGAVAAPLLAVAAAFSFFKKKTKTLDEGIKVAIDGMDVYAETFKKIQTSRFWGLSKKTSTTSTADPDNPIIGAVNSIQEAAIQAARVLGVGAAAFSDFSYEFKLSLMNLNEEQRLEKINEELGKMGDEFASLAPNVENLNQLLERANQISASIRALTDTQTLFATRQEAVFAASQAGNLSSGVDTTQNLLRDLIRAVREGDVNNGRLTAQLVAIQQRQELAPT